MFVYLKDSPGVGASGMSATLATVWAGVAACIGSKSGRSVKSAIPEVCPSRCEIVIAFQPVGQASRKSQIESLGRDLLASLQHQDGHRGELLGE